MIQSPSRRSGRGRRFTTSIALTMAALVCAIAAAAPVPATAEPYHVKTLYGFTKKADGGEPAGGVIEDAAGTLYGTTYRGGSTTCTHTPANGCGTIYSFSPTTGLKTLITFTGPNGALGDGGLTLVGNTLYGNTLNGGSSDDGVIFSVHTDGTQYTLLHQFNGADGKNPEAFLRMAPNGTLYGLTAAGGPNNAGVLFSLQRDGTYTILHAFTGGADGGDPVSLLLSPTGVLVGSTFSGGIISQTCTIGCGTMFTYLLATNKFTVQHSFTYVDGDGASPYVGSLGPGSTVYGAASNIFSLGIAGGFNYLNFDEFDGGAPRSGPLLAPNGTLVGVNSQGPMVVGGDGTIYIVKNGVVSTPYVFGDESDGGDPLAQPIITPSGTLIGTTAAGDRCDNCGTIWEYTP